jgi:uncharacterized protein YcfL
MKLFSILTAAACLLVVSACASTPAPTDERVHVMEANANVSVQPGNVYVSADAAKIFTFRDVETEINENGYLAVRVFGKTCELSALKWAFFGDINYEFAYRFFWFDADGNPVEGPEDFRLRSTIPGDPVRFVGHAPTEECRNYALELRLASEEAAASDSAEAADTAAAEDEGEAESDAAQMEEERVKEIIPDLPEQNVTGDKQDVKVIGISDKDAESVPKAVPTEKE